MKRLAVHGMTLGFTALILGAGLHFIFNYDPYDEKTVAIKAWLAKIGFSQRVEDDGTGVGNGGAVHGGELGAEDGDFRPGSGDGDLASEGEPGLGDGGIGLDDPWLGGDDESTVRLLLVGDIMMGGRVADLLEREGYDYPYRHVGDRLREADIAVGNLENPITDRGEPADKSWTFRTSPLAVPALAESGFDVLSLANNHTLDYGTVGLLDTIRYLDEAGIGRVGGGKDADEAYRPFYVEAKGIRVAFLGFSHVVPEVGWKARKDHPGVAEAYDISRALEAIQEAKREADLVVVLVHWGIEREVEPEPYQVKKGRAFIDAGADLVIGSHPHVLQGLEPYNGKWIAYSLGNFIFTTSLNAETRHSVMLQADCRKDGECRLTAIPVLTGPGQPFYPDEAGTQDILDRLNRLSYQARVNADGTVEADPAGRVYDPEQVAKKKLQAQGEEKTDGSAQPAEPAP